MKEMLTKQKISFHGRMTENSNKVIIIVPKEFHKKVREQKLLKKLLKFDAEEIIE